MIAKSTLILPALAVLLSSCAPVTIRTIPEGADVYNQTGETRLGTAPYDTTIILTGKRFLLRKDQYQDRPITVHAESPRFLDIRMMRKKATTLQSQPSGANVYIERFSRPVGKTPYITDVSEEDKTYTLKLDGYYDKDVMVNLESPDIVMEELQAKPVTISLQSVPSGASVYQSGNPQPLGTTPLKTVVQRQTSYEIQADRHYPATITLSPQSDKETVVALKPLPYITIKSDPPNAELYFEGGLGSSIGTTPVTRLIQESIAFELHKDGYDPERFSLSTNAPNTVTISLKKIPYVTISSKPAGAKLYRKGGVELLGETPVQQIVREPTEFELHLDGYSPKSFVVSGKEPDLTVGLEGNETIYTDKRLSVPEY